MRKRVLHRFTMRPLGDRKTFIELATLCDYIVSPLFDHGPMIRCGFNMSQIPAPRSWRDSFPPGELMWVHWPNITVLGRRQRRHFSVGGFHSDLTVADVLLAGTFEEASSSRRICVPFDFRFRCLAVFCWFLRVVLRSVLWLLGKVITR